VPTTRLSALDASFLEVESATAHMHVGWVATFAPRDDRRRPTYNELLDHIAARIGRAPRYRQRLARVPFGVHDPGVGRRRRLRPRPPRPRLRRRAP